MNKDLILYVANLSDDRAVLNLLSVSKRFRIPENFKRIFQQRYPLIMRFKPEELSWIQFYIEVIYFLGKLKEEFNIDYLPTYDFNPKDVYRFVIKELQQYPETTKRRIDYYTKHTKGYHVLYSSNGEEAPTISDLIIPRKSLQEGILYYMDSKYGFVGEISPMMGLEARQITEGSTVWIGSVTNPEIFSVGNRQFPNMLERTTMHIDPDWLVDSLFNEYLFEVDTFVNDAMENWNPDADVPQPTREEVLALDANNPYNRDQKDLFREQILKPGGVTLRIDTDYPNGDYYVLYFQIVQRKIAVMREV